MQRTGEGEHLHDHTPRCLTADPRGGIATVPEASAARCGTRLHWTVHYFPAGIMLLAVAPLPGLPGQMQISLARIRRVPVLVPHARITRPL